MAVRMTMEFAATAEQYDQVNEAMTATDPPDGLIVHSAVDLGGTMKIVDIWESAEKFGAFAEGTLARRSPRCWAKADPRPSPRSRSSTTTRSTAS